MTARRGPLASSYAGAAALVICALVPFLMLLAKCSAVAASAADRPRVRCAKSLIENSLGGLSYARVLGNLASGFILAIGIIAALDQLHIAANVVNAILYAALAALVGIAIVAIGGGGIKTMSQRWEAVADRYDAEKPRIAAAPGNAPSLREQAHQAVPDNGSSSYGRATATRAQPVADHYPRPDDGYPCI